jgi:asparagine synthase (glutamine-hydrolysing)
VCGIAGIYELDRQASVPQELLQSMCDAIVRRGPDDEGYHVDRNLGLGMRRLSIIDIAGGRQPISNEDGTLTIVFNGEIFNYQPLHEDLVRRGHRFKTHSDTETILHLFEEEGAACLRHLRGMFAFAIWDERNRSLFVARDRLGIKPLHYAFDGARFVFGSEIKSILRVPAVRRTIDWTALDAFFTYGFIPAPRTIYREVRKLRPGYYLQITEHGISETQYWDVSFASKLKGSAEALTDEFLTRFRDSVRMRLLSEVPLGAFLSGGVDSSLVVAIMAEMSRTPVKTFTIGFGGSVGGFLDERPFARDVSERFKTEHHVFEVQPTVEEALDAALDAFDEPFADDSVIPTHHICRLARQHVTVALTGLGGDENFAGYERHLGFGLSALGERAPFRQMLRVGAPMITRLREQRDGNYRINHLKRFIEASHLPPGERWQRYQAIVPREQREQLYQPDVAREIDFDAVDRMGLEYFERCDSSDPLDRALYQDLKFYLPDDILALTDRVGMWHSLELRVPFVDHTLVEFCARLPSSFKLRVSRGEKKVLLRRACKPLLPPSVLDHRKQGFASPMAMWLRGSMNSMVEEDLSAAAITRSGILNPSVLAARLSDHRSRRSLNNKHLFSVLMFERWWRRRQ